MVQDMRKIKRKKERRYLTPLLLILNMFLWGTAFYLWMQDTEAAPPISDNFTTSAEIYLPGTIEPNTFHASAALTYEEVDLQIYSTHALLINLDTGEILFDHRKNERVYPASITKIMTVLVGLEEARGDEVTVYADFNALFLAGSSMAGFTEGEVRTLSDILHGAMLESGGDATTALAYHVAESYQEFVDLMNEMAKRLGMENTHFTNASGLHDDNHYTTAYDIALLLEYALTDPYFRMLFTTSTYPFINSEGHEQIMQSTMFRHLSEVSMTAIFEGGEILGGKTGFTTPAGMCLASIATDGANEFALITFGAHTDVSPRRAHILDAMTIYKYFFDLDNGFEE